ncbi:MAG: HlyD family efflux transporter periplasmic adaptor subunit [Paludibacter sp.]
MKQLNYINIILLLVLLTNCKGKESSEETATKVTTPVTVTSVQITSIGEEITLNAVSAFHQKNIVKATANGYIEKVFVKIGDVVTAGKVLYTLKTKEADALGSIAGKDSTFRFKGEMVIKAPSSGIITELTKSTNDYVADGEQLCVIVQQNSFVFELSVPFEQNKYVHIGESCSLLLPDSSIVSGTITSKLASVDAVSQTQNYVIKPNTNRFLPENLVATVQITKNGKQHAQVLDKNCVLTNETVDSFWVMKMINDSTAVKVPVVKGISTDTRVEILSPKFSKDDRLVITGNYGLPDTAFVKVTPNPPAGGAL